MLAGDVVPIPTLPELSIVTKSLLPLAKVWEVARVLTGRYEFPVRL